MPARAPTQITLEEELERTEGSKAYPHQFKKAQISNSTIRNQGGLGWRPTAVQGGSGTREVARRTRRWRQSASR
jgi:hypothetical protein